MANWPVHKNPKEEHAAKAPYNFVPLPDRVVTVSPDKLPDQDRYDPDRYTGWIDCQLTTASPLYVRAALDLDEFKRSLDTKAEEKLPWESQVRNKPDFFYTRDRLQPVIPGSSLRGMLRALVEIAGYGKVEGVTKRNLVYRAVGDTTSHGERYRERLMNFDGEAYEDGKRYYQYTPLMEAGYMQKAPNGDWYIQPAKKVNGATFARISERNIPGSLQPWKRCKNASVIWVQTGPLDYQKVRGGFIHVRYARVLRASAGPQSGLVEARLVRSGWMANKRSEAVVFEIDRTAKPIEIDDDMARVYRDQLAEAYTQQAVHGGQKSALLGPNGVLEEEQPVFYLVENGKLVFFSHCMMLRIPYRLSPLDFVPEALRQEADIDLAEAIFGFTKREGKGKLGAYAGRVFVSDASLAPGQSPGGVWLDKEHPIVPKILGSPKPTTFQHYLTQQQPDPVPTGGRFADGSPRTRLELSDYASQTPDESVIRGIKLYWHKGAAALADIQDEEPAKKHDTQHTQIRPVKADVAFRFQVRFENLSAVELGALLWVLDTAQKDAYRLALGMGKPYGMGAVKLIPALHLENRRDRYARLFETNDWAKGSPDVNLTQAQAIQAFEAFVLDNLKERGARSLDGLERIKMLLAMLAWPGPDPQQTRYLEIEHKDPTAKRGKVNEYRDRPVLPTPLAVNVKFIKEHRPTRPVQDVVPAGYQRGTVKKFGLGESRSLGFITPDGGGQDVFVHASQLAQGLTTLEPGQRVVFRVGKGMRGPQAEDVRLAS